MALWAAAERGDAVAVHALLQEGNVDVNGRGEGAQTPLICTSVGGHDGTVELLLAAGADVNAVDNSGWSALMYASSFGHSTTMNCLLAAKGVDVCYATPGGYTALKAAARYGHTAAMVMLLKDGAQSNFEDVDGPEGLTPWFWAARRGRVDLIDILLAADVPVDVNATNDDGESALMVSAQEGHVVAVEVLLAAGATDTARALSVAREQGRTLVVTLLEARGVQDEGDADVAMPLVPQGVDFDEMDPDGRTPLIKASMDGDAEAAEQLLEGKAPVSGVDSTGWNALMYASSGGHSAVVRLLLLSHGDGHFITERGLTPLMAASGHGHTATVVMLLNAGAEIDSVDEDGFSALMYAARKGHLHTIIALVKAGADMMLAESVTGWTALMYAAREGHLDTVIALFKAGADANCKVAVGTTALVMAAKEGATDVIKTLVAAAVDVNAADEHGLTALIAATDRGHVEALHVLLTSRAAVDATYHGGTALMRASFFGYAEVVRKLLEHSGDVGFINWGITVNDGFIIKCTPLVAACEGGHLDVVKVLLSSGDNVFQRSNGLVALARAQKRGDTSIAALLEAEMTQKEGLQVRAEEADCVDADALKAMIRQKGYDTFDNLLVKLSIAGETDCVELLLEAGADVDQVVRYDGDTALICALTRGGTALDQIDGYDGSTALVCASTRGHTAVVKLLIARGANVNFVASDHSTALFEAVKGEHIDVAVALLDAGADPNPRSYYGGFTPLMVAAARGMVEFIRVLVNGGAAVDCVNHEKWGETALFVAVRWDNVRVVRALLDLGAAVDVRSDGELTPLMLASLLGHLEIVEMLLGASADVDATMREEDGDQTALTLACANGHVGVVDALIRGGSDVLGPANASALRLASASDCTERLAVVDLLTKRIKQASDWKKRGWLICMREQRTKLLLQQAQEQAAAKKELLLQQAREEAAAQKELVLQQM